MKKVLNIRLGEGLAGSMKSALYISRCLKEANIPNLTILSKDSLGKRLAKSFGIRIKEVDNLRLPNIVELIIDLAKNQGYNIFISHTEEDRKVLLSCYRRGLRGKFISFRRNEPKTLPVIGYFLSNFFFTKFIAVSESVKQSLIKKGFPKDKITVIKNAIDYKEFKDINKHKLKSLRKELGLENNLPVLGMVSAFHEYRKGFDVLFKALALINFKVNLLIIGINPEFQGRIIELAKACKDLSLLVLPFVDFLEIPVYYKLMDLFILPSRSEGLPLALLEACACGVPVIASDIPGIREVIKNNYNGILFRCGDARALAWNITSLLQRKDISRRLAESAKQNIINNFNIDKLKLQFIEFIKSL